MITPRDIENMEIAHLELPPKKPFKTTTIVEEDIMHPNVSPERMIRMRSNIIMNEK